MRRDFTPEQIALGEQIAANQGPVTADDMQGALRALQALYGAERARVAELEAEHE